MAKGNTGGAGIALPNIDKGALKQIAELQAVVKELLVKDVDYGAAFTGSKDVLLLPGAQKLVQIFGLIADPVQTAKHEDWKFELHGSIAPLFDYEFTTRFTRESDGVLAGVGVGSANSHEAKWLYRNSEKQCPHCGQPAIMRSKFGDEYGNPPGWYCFSKKGGCNAKFAANDPNIVNQRAGRIINPELATEKNTVLKIAKKRSYIDGTLASTGLSCLFTQDIEVESEQSDSNEQPPAAAPVQNVKGDIVVIPYGPEVQQAAAQVVQALQAPPPSQSPAPEQPAPPPVAAPDPKPDAMAAETQTSSTQSTESTSAPNASPSEEGKRQRKRRTASTTEAPAPQVATAQEPTPAQQPSSPGLAGKPGLMAILQAATAAGYTQDETGTICGDLLEAMGIPKTMDTAQVIEKLTEPMTQHCIMWFTSNRKAA